MVEVDGYEADDVIGTLALKAREAGLEAVIVSGDKDLYQLVGPGIHLLNPGRGGPTGVEPEWVDESNAERKFGIPPERIPDYLALIGDSSDNVPGAPGVGPKTAVKLLQEYGDLEEILDQAAEISGKRARESLTENADLVRLSKRLVTIQTDVPIELDLEVLEVQEPDRERLQKALRRTGVPSSGRAVHGPWRGSPAGRCLAESVEEIPVTYTLVEDVGEVAEMVQANPIGGGCLGGYGDHQPGRHQGRAGGDLPLHGTRGGLLPPPGPSALRRAGAGRRRSGGSGQSPGPPLTLHGALWWRCWRIPQSRRPGRT